MQTITHFLWSDQLAFVLMALPIHFAICLWQNTLMAWEWGSPIDSVSICGVKWSGAGLWWNGLDVVMLKWQDIFLLITRSFDLACIGRKFRQPPPPLWTHSVTDWLTRSCYVCVSILESLVRYNQSKSNALYCCQFWRNVTTKVVVFLFAFYGVSVQVEFYPCFAACKEFKSNSILQRSSVCLISNARERTVIYQMSLPNWIGFHYTM